jgi:Copper type II ascorbate-dependent monooxygenase, C-terminal domain
MLRSSLLPIVALALASGCGSSVSPKTGVGGHRPATEVQDCDFTLTKYLGDCVAPPPVDPADGLVAKYGPTDYDNPDEVAKYVVEPGTEPLDCGYSRLPNDSDFFYNRYQVRSRPGMHHVILYASNLDVPDGLHDDCQIRDQGGRMLAVLQGGIDGGIYNYPPSGKMAPENATLGTRLAPHQAIAYELHAVNATDEPLLRENWTIFWSMPPDDVKGTVEQIAFNGGLMMNIPAHTQQTISNSCTVPEAIGDIRVVDFFAHMHAHGKRFSAWTVTKDPVTAAETRTLVYESYDWSLLDLIEFNSVDDNQAVTYDGGVPGGVSGDLLLRPGDRLEYECAMNNTEDHNLVFAARAFAGEMCNMFGTIAPGDHGPWSCMGD